LPVWRCLLASMSGRTASGTLHSTLRFRILECGSRAQISSPLLHGGNHALHTQGDTLKSLPSSRSCTSRASVFGRPAPRNNGRLNLEPGPTVSVSNMRCGLSLTQNEVRSLTQNKVTSAQLDGRRANCLLSGKTAYLRACRPSSFQCRTSACYRGASTAAYPPYSTQAFRPVCRANESPLAKRSPQARRAEAR